MSVLWTVRPVDEAMRNWLDELDVAYPNKASRFPTGIEIKAILAALSDYDVSINDLGIGAPWQAAIVHKSGDRVGPWTTLNIVSYTGDELPQQLSFARGSEKLVTETLQRLSKKCGPLVLIADRDSAPMVIDA